MELSRAAADRLISRYGGSLRAWRLTLGAVFAAEALMLLWVGRHQWYFFDEWRLIVERVIPNAHGLNGWFKQLFRPDGEHVIALPLAVFIVFARLVGLGSYWPFIIANVFVRVGTLWLVDDILRRLSARRLARLIVVISIAFFGAGFESLFGQSIIFAGFTMIFCLLAIREMLTPRTSQWRGGGIAAAYLVGAIFSSSYGFPVVVGVALYYVLTSRRIAAALSFVVPPVAFLAVRAIAGGSYGQQQPLSLDRVPLYIDYVQFGLAKLGDGITGLDGLGLGSYIALVVLCIWFGRGRQQAWFAIAMVCSVVAFFGQASLSRSVFGADQAGASRYLFFCGVLTFIMLGASWGTRRLNRRAAVTVALVIVVSLTNSVGRVIDGRTFYTTNMELSRARLALGFAAADRGFDGLVPDPDWAPDLYLSRLQTVVKWSGANSLTGIGQACFSRRIEELAADGVDPSTLPLRQQAALVLLLNEHSLGYGDAKLTLGGLIEAGANADNRNKVVDQFKDDYATLVTDLQSPSAMPSLARCL